MKETIFNTLLTQITSKLNVLKELGVPITTELINEKIDEVAKEFQNIPNFEMTETDIQRLKFQIGSCNFNVKVGEKSITLHNPDLPRWFDSKKHEVQWKHWTAYKTMLESQGRPKTIIDANEAVIDDVLDYSGDPTTPGTWSRKGLVMGNVQSGKTQNYIGLINKGIDAGYKTIILLGGHLNDLRMQTQERVDEGILGRKSKHHLEMENVEPAPIGVGIYGENSINTGTTTIGDFNKGFADRLGFKLTGEDPVIFTVKKHTGVMDKLYSWIKDYHYLDPDNNRRLQGPLLLIDDEADYASINTKHHKEEVTLTNECIRNLLSLFERNTYVAYTATPFANIFIDPDDANFSDKSDIFPSDFMIKMPVPDNYLGQDFYFPQKSAGERNQGGLFNHKYSPTVPIADHAPIYELKSCDTIQKIPESLKKAVRAFLLVIAIRSLRGDHHAHNTMLVNISHLKDHQNKLEFLISEYHKLIDDALNSYSGLGIEEARKVDNLKDLEKTFDTTFSIGEKYEDVFSRLKEASGKLKVWAINQSNKKSDGKVLNYSIHKEHGLCAIIIGGHKLSRGLTLEGLSISYFARNSKAYDTLMQMCRWFGYRSNYDDLCKVFLPQESIDWYTFIASAINELYQELELMSRREQRPSEFGLKVREHPGAMIITAKNKMGASETEVRSQDLWGQVQRRFRFRPEKDSNERNLQFTKSYISNLVQKVGNKNSFIDDKSGSLVIKNCDYEDLINYIQEIDLLEDDLGNAALIKHLKKMDEAGLGKPRVVLFNQVGTRNPKWMVDLSAEDAEFINEPYKFPGQIEMTLPKRLMKFDGKEYKVSSTHLGNSDDEKLFLSDNEREVVQTQVGEKKAVSFDYVCSDERDYPGLIIYHFAVAIKDKEQNKYILGHGKMPTVGFTVSIPRSENLKGKSQDEIKEIVKKTKHSYQVNKIHTQLQLLSAYEEYEDDE